MRVFQLNTFCGEKSTGRIALEIARLVERDGGQCRIGYGAGTPPKEAEPYAFRIGNSLERKSCSQLRKLLDFEGRGCYFGTRTLVEELERFQPDLVHFHNLHGCYLHLPTLCHYLAHKNIPIVWTLHDCWCFTGHCVYFDYVDCDKWKTGCFDCPQKKEYPARIGPDMSRTNYMKKKRIFTGVSNMTLVTPSQWLTDLLQDSYMNEYDVKVIHNGVDTEVFRPVDSRIKERYSCADKKIVLGVAAIWDKRKGLPSFIELSKKLDDIYRIILVGLTKEQIKSLPSNMIAIEHTNSVKELVELYSAADIFVNPTLEDNYPTTNLEAIACGIPVVTYDTGGSPESAKMYGTHVPKRDVQALMRAIEDSETFKPINVDVNYQTSVQKYMRLYEGKIL